MRPHKLAAAGLVAVSLLGAPLSAQEFPGFGSLEARAGLVFPDDASTGFGVSVDIGLGFFGSPTLRTLVGFHFFDADVSHVLVPGSPGIEGSISATGGRVGLRLDPFGAAAIGPYLLAAATAHNVTVDAPTAGARLQLDRVFGGFVIGGALGGGVTYALDPNQRFVATGEVRRVFVANIPHWSGEVGIRIVPRGRGAYDPVIRFHDPWATQAPAPAAFTTEAERLRLERERLEAAQRAEQERLARMTEEERRAFLATEEARLRAGADAARTATDAELERARRETAEARAAAEAAERRAREAEDRLYRALLDLDRLIANVTAIRETERGLSLVLGEGLFAVGQHTLSPRARDEVQRIAAVLLQFPQYVISVEGHTDSTGALTMNQRLSEQRAHAVRAGLVAEGVDPNRVGVVGHGPLLPIADNATVAGRAQNRRVEIILLGAQRPATQVIR